MCASLLGPRLIDVTGYDGSLMGSINALPNYLKYYNVSENEQAGTGIVFAIFQVGQMTGALFVWLADWQGRKIPIFLGCFGVIIGTIVTATAKTSASLARSVLLDLDNL